VKKGKTERYLKNELSFTEFMLELGTQDTRLVLEDGADPCSGKRLLELMRKLIRFEQILTMLEKRKKAPSVIRTILLEAPLTRKELREMDELRPYISALQERYEALYPHYAPMEVEYQMDEEFNAYRVIFKTRKEGIIQETVVDCSFLLSGEYRELRHLSNVITTLGRPPFRLQVGESTEEFGHVRDLIQGVMEIGRKGFNIQRYKGLGEMNPDQLWDTTMNPETRTLLQVRVEDPVEADNIFTVLMGDLVEPRREFIQKHAPEVRNLDA
jgi:DNA gyrase subunit B